MFADNTEYDNDMDYNSADDNFDDSDSKGNESLFIVLQVPRTFSLT